MDTTNKIQSLVESIKKHNEAYRHGTPIVSDSAYDQEVEQLKQLDPNNPWFSHIEPVSVKNSRKVRLPIPMKSLYKVKSIDQLQKWAASMGLRDNFQLVITPKFDGLSLLHNELDGMTYSRGGAENEGQDCTTHYQMAGYPQIASNLHYTYGEFVFSRKSWKENFAEKEAVMAVNGETYKSARATAAGLLNRDEPSPLLKHVDFFRYGTDATSIQHFTTYANFYEYLCDTFNQPKLYFVAPIADISEDLLHRLFDAWRLEYFIDGLVLYFNEIALWDKVGRQETTGNPNYAIAYKNPDFTDVFETTVKSVTWAISKIGCFKPVVDVETVDTGECEIKSPTGYNARWIRDHNVAPGAKVKLTRSGDVIPKITEIIQPATKESVDAMWDTLCECPHCHTSLCWGQSGAELCCPNLDCSGRQLAALKHFFETVGSEGVGPETISKMYDAGFTTVGKILDITFEELLDIETFGDDTANLILQNNAKIRQGLDAATAMAASNCFPGFGKVKASQMLAKMNKEYRFAFINGQLPEIQPEIFRKMYLQAKRTEQIFYDGIQAFYDFITTNKLVILPPEEPKTPTSDKYAGIKVCFTGIRDKLLEAEILDGGGAVSSNVSKTVTHVIVADHSSTSTKAKYAERHGVPILTIEEFRALM